MYYESAETVLQKALIDLLQKKDIERISLKEILEYSNVSKTTFYRFYDNKFDLMNSCYKSAIDKYLAKLKYDNWDDILIAQFRFFDSNRKFMLNGFKGQGRESLKRFIFEYSSDFYRKEMQIRKGVESLTPDEENAIMFNAGGSCELLEAWLINPKKFDYTVDEMAMLHYKLMPDMMRCWFPQRDGQND